MKKLSNVKYELIPSYNDKLKEVTVHYTLDGVPHHYFVFVQKKEKETDKYYLNEAKKKFDADYKSGKVYKSTKIDHSKPWLIAGVSVFGAAAIALGGFFTYKYLTGGLGGGGTYQPGQQVKVNAAVEDPSGGNYQVTFDNNEAKVGEKYHTSINLTPKNPTNDEYVLPDKLVSVISNNTALKEEQYKYTLGENKTTAELDVEGQYVYGPVTVSLVLVSTSQPGPGPEPGPTPEPINWVDTDEAGIIPIRNNIMIAHNGMSPLIYLPSILGGHQFKLEAIFSGGHLNDANELQQGSYDIDTDALYIKRVYNEGKKSNAEKTEYMTYHVDETSPLKSGVYKCFADYSETKMSNFVYMAESIDKGIKLFTNLNADVDVVDYADVIYATERYEPTTSEKEHYSDITCVEDYLNFVVGELKLEIPEIKYQKGNDLSLKITSDVGPTPYSGMTIEAHLELIIENAITKHSLFVVEASQGGVKTDAARIETKLTIPEKPFAPDDLSEYFKK